MRFAADVRYAVRMLVRRPAFTALAAFTLALGIGATTAIFSVVHPILFASLPYPSADRLTMIWERIRSGEHNNVGFTTFADLAREARSVESMSAMGGWQPTFTGRAEPERFEGQRVSPSFFKTLGVHPAFGRDFRAEEDVRGAPRVTILSHALWRSRFGGDSTLVGKEITLDGNAFTVLGVMPGGFENVLEPKAQLYTLLRYNETLPQACRSCRHLRVVARLAPGATHAAASAEVEAIARRLFSEYPTDYSDNGIAVQALNDQVAGGVKPVLLALLGAVGLVLLIACANVTNLLLARGVQRQGEFAVRAALGAGRPQPIGPLVVERVFLALLGGALGVGVAEIGVKTLVALSPVNLPRLSAIEVNSTVLLFTFGVTALVGIAFGLVPALVGARSDLHLGLKAGSRRATGSGQFARATLVVGEVAVAVVLLVGAGLLLRSVGGLLAVSPGFDAGKLLTVQVQSSGPRFLNDTMIRSYFDEVLAKVQAVPGVIDVGYTSQLPLSGDYDAFGMRLENRPTTTGSAGAEAFRYSVSAGYLTASPIPVIRGRGVT